MNTNLGANEITDLPAGFRARGATMDDIQPAFRLFNRWSNAVLGRDEFADLETIRNEWEYPDADLAGDTRLIFAPNGELAGYVEVWTTAEPSAHPELWGRVDPRYEDLGLGTWLMRWAERRALRALKSLPADVRFAPHVGTYRQAGKAKKLFEDFGYRRVRSMYHMLMEMTAPVPEPQFPSGIELQPFVKGQHDIAVWQAQNEAFRDHWGHEDMTFEDWKHDRCEDPDFDPTLWFLAKDEDVVAGYIICRPHSFSDPERGWVRSLGVRRPWRKQGIGRALLRYAFREFYRRGTRKVGLGVDAENLTGALRLYENAGMHIDQAFDRYEKELRPGLAGDENSLLITEPGRLGETPGVAVAVKE